MPLILTLYINTYCKTVRVFLLIIQILIYIHVLLIKNTHTVLLYICMYKAKIKSNIAKYFLFVSYPSESNNNKKILQNCNLPNQHFCIS